ncbi:MAG: tRNA sulfurtransferase [Acidimicrobiia bacterium]
MPDTPDAATVHVTLSGDVYLKSRRTQKGLIAKVRRNLEIALHKAGYRGGFERIGTHRFSLSPEPELRQAVVDASATVFGVASVDTVVELAFDDFDDLVLAVVDASEHRIQNTTFAVRPKRRGAHTWKSPDLARAVGAALVERGGSVDLTNPGVEVAVRVLDDRAFLVTDHTIGAGGLPLGTQDRVLCLLSGGFDSVVAAWMLMSRGCPVDFVHFSLNCAQSDHALAVGRELWDRWGHGSDPTVHLVEFQPVKDALFNHVPSRMRQVTLKVMMARAADDIAQNQSIAALVTGDSIGQVSSQTLPHLVAVSAASRTPILRPLSGLPKESIIDLARRVGTAELSARAQEVCDLSEGRPVATSAGEQEIDDSVEQVPDAVLADALTTAKAFKLRDWTPGQF